MKIELWAIGKTKYSFLEEGESMYRDRIKHYCQFSFQYYKQVKNASRLPPILLMKEEAKMILKHLDSKDYLVLLDENGKDYTSEKFAQKIGTWQNQSIRRLIFLIGGAYGFDSALKQRANESLSMSKMTFSHQLIRTIFLEQLYRGFSILNNESYHNS